MAEHDSDREDREPDEQGVPFDEEAAWAAIVAGYGEEPPDPPGTKPFKPVEDLALPATVVNADEEGESDGADGADEDNPEGDEAKGDAPTTAPTGTAEATEAAAPAEADDSGAARPAQGPGPVKPLGGSISFAPGVGPRDYRVPEPTDDDFDEDDEGHFVPPEPPPLPTADTTARFAWLGVIGGPVLLLVAVLFRWDMTWWLTTLGIGGFLGGFATLVARMKTDDEDGDDPGRGAVV